MKKLSFILATLLMLTLCCTAFTVFASYNDNYVKTTDVESVTGQKGVTCNSDGKNYTFYNKAQVQIVEVKFYNKAEADPWIAKCNGALKGIGDEAWQGSISPNYPPNLLVFHVGTQYVVMTVYHTTTAPGNMLTDAQTRRLAAIIASRLLIHYK